MRPVELFYSVSELAILLRFSDATVRRWVKEGRFSPPGEDGKADLSNCLEIGQDIRVPASGVQFFCAHNPLKYDLGIKARNKGELIRKLKQSPDVQTAV